MEEKIITIQYARWHKLYTSAGIVLCSIIAYFLFTEFIDEGNPYITLAIFFSLLWFVYELLELSFRSIIFNKSNNTVTIRSLASTHIISKDTVSKIKIERQKMWRSRGPNDYTFAFYMVNSKIIRVEAIRYPNLAYIQKKLIEETLERRVIEQ